ncbi:MAG TPA: hypothetical protein VGQ36_18110 [Thermoanaerobaculia bacterium]|jgi:hypothetical protein|nr:hypothetical protein [Thermoanaerobaculia bacterium]
MRLEVIAGTADPTAGGVIPCTGAYVIVTVQHHDLTAATGQRIRAGTTTTTDTVLYVSGGSEETTGLAAVAGITLRAVRTGTEAWPLQRTVRVAVAGQRFEFTVTLAVGVQNKLLTLRALFIEEMGHYVRATPTVASGTETLITDEWLPVPTALAGNHRVYFNKGHGAEPQPQNPAADYVRTGKYLAFRARIAGAPGEIEGHTISWSFTTWQRLAQSGNVFNAVRGVVDTKSRPCFYAGVFSYPDTLTSTTNSDGYTGIVYFYLSGSGGDQYDVVAHAGDFQLQATTPAFTVWRRLDYYRILRHGAQIPANLQAFFDPAFIELHRVTDRDAADIVLQAYGYDEQSQEFIVVYSNLQATTYNDDWNYRLIYRARQVGGPPAGWLAGIRYRNHGTLAWTEHAVGGAAAALEGSVVTLNLMVPPAPPVAPTPDELAVLTGARYLHPAGATKNPVIGPRCTANAPPFDPAYVAIPQPLTDPRESYQVVDTQNNLDLPFTERDVLGDASKSATTVAAPVLNTNRLRVPDDFLRRVFFLDVAPIGLNPTPAAAIDVQIIYARAKFYSGNAPPSFATTKPTAQIAMDSIAANVGAAAAPEVGAVALAHEIQHLLGGFVTGAPSHTRVGTGGHHCTDVQCVQYWTTMSAYGKRFCANCLAYLQLIDLARASQISAE